MAYDPNLTPPPPHLKSSRYRDRTGLWVWIVLLVIAGFVIWIAFTYSGGNLNAKTVNRNNSEYAGGSIGSRNQRETAANSAGNQAAPAPITSLAQLDHLNEGWLAGAPVDLPVATVAQTGGAGAFLIQAGHNQVLVVPTSAQGAAAAGPGTSRPSAPLLKPGETVRIQGTVRKLPTKPEDMYEFKLSGGEATWAGKTGIYISATTVTPTQK